MGMNQLGLFDLTNSPNKGVSNGVSPSEASKDLEIARLREELDQARYEASEL